MGTKVKAKDGDEKAGFGVERFPQWLTGAAEK
jgi:hypothetical protein